MTTYLPLGKYHLTKKEIIEFAGRYDPQPMHLDEELAKETLVGGLCASGLHSCIILAQMMEDSSVGPRSTVLNTAGLSMCRWLKPVTPDQTLEGRIIFPNGVKAATATIGRPTDFRVELVGEHGDILMVWDFTPPPAENQPDAGEAAADSPNPLIRMDKFISGPKSNLSRNFFEDRLVGENCCLGNHTFSDEEVMGFKALVGARDVSESHPDEIRTRGLVPPWQIATAWVRMSVAQRQAVDTAIRLAGIYSSARYGPSPGFKNMRWLRSVKVGETITFYSKLSSRKELKSRPHLGLLESRVCAFDLDGAAVFTVTGQIFAERRQDWQ